jgi:phosphoglycerate dehydrogenase-like enzyme
MLAHVRRLPLLAEQQRARQWEPTPRPTLAGQRLTIVGYGAIGRGLARIACALGMRVRAVSRTGVPRDRTGSGSAAAENEIEVVGVSRLAEAVADAAFIVIAVPLTPETRRLFDGPLLDRLRPDAFLVNAARGGIVDEDALAGALSAGRLAGAALDVFESEPLPPDSPLWTVPRLMITPHIAGLGERYVERCVDVLLVNVAALEAGVRRQGLVDRDVGY